MIKQALGRIVRKFGLKQSGKSILPQHPVEPTSYYGAALAFVQQIQASYYSGSASGPVIDSMTTPNELAFLREYGKLLFRGKGKIVDLGCWFGATSAALADGLKQNSNVTDADIIEAYDLFEWEDWMEPIKEQIGMQVELSSNQCFLDIVEKNLAQYGSRIKLHKQDLSRFEPPADWKLEFLFVDAMKNWELADTIATSFFTRMIEGESLVVMQDFAFYDPIVATNHLLMWHLKDFFTPLHHVPDSCSMVFLTMKTPDRSDLLAYSPTSFSEEDVTAAYIYCLPLVQDSMKSSLKVARLCHHLMCQHELGSIQAIAALEGDVLSDPMKATIQRYLTETYADPTDSWKRFQPTVMSEMAKLLSLEL
jgi:hypothetical protein